MLLKLVGLMATMRPSRKEEGVGMDVPQHGEEAYTSGEGAILVMTDRAPAVDARNPGGSLSATASGSSGVSLPPEGRP